MTLHLRTDTDIYTDDTATYTSSKTLKWLNLSCKSVLMNLLHGASIMIWRSIMVKKHSGIRSRLEAYEPSHEKPCLWGLRPGKTPVLSHNRR